MRLETALGDGQSFQLEPIHVTIRVACAITGDSRTRIYEAIKNGEVDAVKDGKRTLLVYESLKRRAAKRESSASPPSRAWEYLTIPCRFRFQCQ